MFANLTVTGALFKPSGMPASMVVKGVLLLGSRGVVGIVFCCTLSRQILH